MADGRPRRRAKRALGRNEQVVRVLRMLRDLDRVGGATLYELADRYGTAVRTIRRDLEALEEAGIPVRREPTEDSSKHRWLLDGDATGRLANLLDATHYLALRLAMDEGKAVRKAEHLFATLEDLSERVERALGVKGRAQLKEINDCFFSWEKFAWRSAPVDVLWPLVKAISLQRVCSVTYRAPTSGNTVRTFKVLPLRLFVHNGALYLHAWQPKFRQVLLLNLMRLKALEVHDDTLPPPPDYHPEKLEASAFGIFIGPDPIRYRLRFDAAVAPYIEERTWHPTQVLEREADGRLLLTFECSESYEVPAWVASWRDHVEVLEPEKLRDDFAGFARWLAQTYTRPA
jgi:predicted DNA-binding transcriptional regulator YafY